MVASVSGRKCTRIVVIMGGRKILRDARLMMRTQVGIDCVWLIDGESAGGGGNVPPALFVCCPS
jgi:hypothetical protein